MGKTLTRPATSRKTSKTTSPPKETPPEPISLIDASLVPEVYAGKWVARKKFATCFTFSEKHETETFVDKDAPLSSELHRIDKDMGALYLLKDVHGRVVEVVNKDRLQELCKR